jgi:hypothetical protein
MIYKLALQIYHSLHRCSSVFPRLRQELTRRRRLPSSWAEKNHICDAAGWQWIWSEYSKPRVCVIDLVFTKKPCEIPVFCCWGYIYIYDYIVYIYIISYIYICVYICIEYLKWSLYNDLNMLVLPNGLKSLTGPVGYRPERGQQCIGHERWEKIRRRWFDMIQM